MCDFVFIDGKADCEMFPVIQRMHKRGQLIASEYKARGVRFLPFQVMRPIFEKADVLEGEGKKNTVLKNLNEDFLINPFT